MTDDFERLELDEYLEYRAMQDAQKAQVGKIGFTDVPWWSERIFRIFVIFAVFFVLFTCGAFAAGAP